MLLRLGLEAADRVAAALPAGLAYRLADLAGLIRFRLATRARRLAAANLARVCAASGRPTRGPEFRRLVRRAFVEHARYYLELLRLPHVPAAELDARIEAEDWERWGPLFRSGVVVASLHLGNFEPFGHYLAQRGVSGVAPIEEIQPPQLFEFLRRRRGVGRGVELIPRSRSRRRLVAALHAGQFVALIADRDLDGDGLPVTFFGHATTMPAGPAALALMTGRPLVVARVLRTGPERFHGRAWQIETPGSGDRSSDARAMTAEMTRRFEAAIAEAPEQWWGAFQPIWPDLAHGSRA
jgi:phosphatidylinositol dimannoside acyltransferase